MESVASVSGPLITSSPMPLLAAQCLVLLDRCWFVSQLCGQTHFKAQNGVVKEGIDGRRVVPLGVMNLHRDCLAANQNVCLTSCRWTEGACRVLTILLT